MKKSHIGAVLAVVVAAVAASLVFSTSSRSAPLGDAYIYSDLSDPAGRLRIQAIDETKPAMLDVEGALAAHVDGASGNTCAVDIDRAVWQGAALSGSFKSLAHMSADVPPMVRTDSHGNCLFPQDDTHLGIVRANRAGAATLAVGAGDFKWNSIDYVPAIDMLAIVGVDQYAIVQNAAAATAIKPVKIHGKVMGLNVDGLSCCARLSPDGKTLYAVADTGDEDLSGHTVLAAFDGATGDFKRVYLPYFGQAIDCQKQETQRAARELCEQHQAFPARSFDKPKIAFAEGDEQSFDLSPDGHTLYARAFTGIDASSDDAQRSQVVAIDTQTGKATPLPIASYGRVAVSASGKYLLVEHATTITSVYVDGVANHGDLSASKAAKDEPRLNLYTLPDGKFVRALSGDKLSGVLLGQF
jgi:hypothetical protein